MTRADQDLRIKRRQNKAHRVICSGRDLVDHLVQCPPSFDWRRIERDNKGLPKVTYKLEARAGLNHNMLTLHPWLPFPVKKTWGPLFSASQQTPLLKTQVSLFPAYLIAQCFPGKKRLIKLWEMCPWIPDVPNRFLDHSRVELPHLA